MCVCVCVLRRSYHFSSFFLSLFCFHFLLCPCSLFLPFICLFLSLALSSSIYYSAYLSPLLAGLSFHGCLVMFHSLNILSVSLFWTLLPATFLPALGANTLLLHVLSLPVSWLLSTHFLISQTQIFSLSTTLFWSPLHLLLFLCLVAAILLVCVYVCVCVRVRVCMCMCVHVYVRACDFLSNVYQIYIIKSLYTAVTAVVLFPPPPPPHNLSCTRLCSVFHYGDALNRLWSNLIRLVLTS